MKKSLFLMSLILLGSILFSQVGIGTNTPHSSAVLDITSNNKGVLFPTVALTSSTDVTTINNPQKGLIVWVSTTQQDIEADNFYYWSGSKWRKFSSVNSSSKSLELVAYFTKTSDQNTETNVITPVSFNNDIFKNADFLDFSNDTFTILSNGIYTFDFQVGFLNSETNSDIIIGLCNNSNQWIGRSAYRQSGGRTFNNYSSVLELNQGDTVKPCVLYTNSNNTIQGIQTGSTGSGNLTNIKVSYFPN